MTPRFALNVSATLAHRPLLERFGIAAAAGFEAIELYWPDDATRDGASLADVATAIRDAGLGVALINVDGDAVEPVLHRFDARLQRALELAEAVGCRRLNLPAGEGDRTDPETRALVTDRAARAADACRPHGIEVELEAINPTSEPRWLLTDVDEVLDVLRTAGRPNLRLQLDVFHVLMVGRDVMTTIDACAGWTGHVQIADMPGRHEPGTGTLPLTAILRRLLERGYAGDIGLEYRPTLQSGDAFAYLPALRGAVVEATRRIPERRTP